MSENEELLQLFVDDCGVIWFASGTGPAHSTTQSIAAFVGGERVAQAGCIRLLGLHQHAELICLLYDKQTELRAAGRTCQLQVGSAAACPRRRDRLDPDTLLGEMRRLDTLRRSQGGWHDVTEQDIACYQLLLYSRGLAAFPEEGLWEPMMLHAALKHPAWPAVSFVRRGNQLAMAQLLAEIVDPRWYVHPERPDSCSRLWQYLGLIEANMRAIWNGKDCSRLNGSRARLVLEAWAGGYRKPPPYPALDEPGHFLWRRFCEFKRTSLGALRASQQLVLLLRHFWLDATDPLDRELFVAEHMFCRQGRQVVLVDQDGTTARAFRQHLTQHLV